MDISIHKSPDVARFHIFFRKMLLSSIQLYPMPAMEASLLALVLSRQKS